MNFIYYEYIFIVFVLICICIVETPFKSIGRFFFIPKLWKSDGARYIFCALGTGDARYQNGWIFRKVPKGGGTLGTFPKIHPFWWRHLSLMKINILFEWWWTFCASVPLAPCSLCPRLSFHTLSIPGICLIHHILKKNLFQFLEFVLYIIFFFKNTLSIPGICLIHHI